MDVLVLLCVASVILAGCCEGAGLLVDDELNAAVGENVTFTTTLKSTQNLNYFLWDFNFQSVVRYWRNRRTEWTYGKYRSRMDFSRLNGSLELRNLTLNDSGSYGVLIFGHRIRKINKGRTILNIYEPVSNVRVNASDTDLLAFNSSLRLSCSSAGSSLNFLWMKGSAKVQLTDGNSTLTIVNVTRNDHGNYSCYVFNPISNGTSDSVNISVSFGPDIPSLNLLPSGSFYEEGSNITLTCLAVSRPTAEVLWTLNGKQLNDSGPQLTLTNVELDQSGNYSCQASNTKTQRQQTSQPAVISVVKKISGASLNSTTDQVIEEMSVNLTCAPASTVFRRQWKKDGKALILTEGMTLHNEGSVLSFHSVKKTHSGDYACNISNLVNSVAVKYNMVVNYGPENVLITGPSVINLNNTLKLTCSTESKPSAEFTWLLNSKVILQKSASFTKDVSEFSDSGLYTCKATNKITKRTSSANHKVSVSVTGPPTGPSVCITGIIIATCVIGGLCALGLFFFFLRDKHPCNICQRKTKPDGGGKNKGAPSEIQEVIYNDITFKKEERVPQQINNNTTIYAEVKFPAKSYKPTCDARVDPAPQSHMG